MTVTTMDRLLEIAAPAPSLDGAPPREIATPMKSLEWVRVDQLYPDPDNPRVTVRNLDRLAASIRRVGILNPLVARYVEHRRIIVMGHRRLAAAQRLRMEHVPVVMRQDELTRVDVLRAQLTENSQRESVDPIEEAQALRKFMHAARIATHAEAAEALGHSQQWVGGRLALLDLPKSDQWAVSEGQITLSKAIDKARKYSGTARAPRLEVTHKNSHFGPKHGLAKAAGQLCEKHKEPKIAGNIACGHCWEVTIRADACSPRQRKALG